MHFTVCLHTTSYIGNLVAGAYAVTVTDSFGCSMTATDTLLNNSVLPVYVTTNGPFCNENDGLALANASGQPPFHYHWSNNITDSIASNLVAGTYYLTVSDNLGCSAVDTVIMSAVSELNITYSELDNSSNNCHGNGSISITMTDSTAHYSYLWSDGNTNASRNGLNGGDYYVTVTDISGCSGSLYINVGGINYHLNCNINQEEDAYSCGDPGSAGTIAFYSSLP